MIEIVKLLLLSLVTIEPINSLRHEVEDSNAIKARVLLFKDKPDCIVAELTYDQIIWVHKTLSQKSIYYLSITRVPIISIRSRIIPSLMDPPLCIRRFTLSKLFQKEFGGWIRILKSY